VQRELSMPFDVDGQEVFTSASIGIALGGGVNSIRPEDLLRDADTAMYRAKGMGIAKHAVFDVTMHDRAVAVLQLENDLRRAIERGELRVQYQPIVALGSGRIVGFEALARWQHRQRGIVAPSEFVPLAEETGVIGSVGRWVLQEACTQMRRLQANFPRDKALTLSVNISGRQVLQPDLVEQIDDTLRATGLDARSLRLEITESVLVENAAAATRCLMRLRQLGLQLCIDDFGTGYSSLSYLHRLPIDLLKIDSSFVRTMGSDEKNRRIVETILLLGRNLGVEVVAEGVETTAQATALHRLGCGFVQGFLFSHPVDIAANSSVDEPRRAGGRGRRAARHVRRRREGAGREADPGGSEGADRSVRRAARRGRSVRHQARARRGSEGEGPDARAMVREGGHRIRRGSQRRRDEEVLRAEQGADGRSVVRSDQRPHRQLLEAAEGARASHQDDRGFEGEARRAD